MVITYIVGRDKIKYTLITQTRHPQRAVRICFAQSHYEFNESITLTYVKIHTVFHKILSVLYFTILSNRGLSPSRMVNLRNIEIAFMRGLF